jgi:hypothetical protein
MQSLYIDNRDGFGSRDFTRFLLDRDQFFRHTKNEPQLFDFTVINVDDPASVHYASLVQNHANIQGYWRFGELPLEGLFPPMVASASVAVTTSAKLIKGTGLDAQNGMAITTAGNLTSVYKAADSSGNGNVGTYIGCTLGQPGALSDGNYSAKFNGVDDYVTVSDSVSLSPTAQVTAEAWVNPASFVTTAVNGIVCKDVGGTASTNPPYCLQLDSTGHVQWIMNSAPDVFHSIQAPAALTLNAWSYVVGTYDGATMRLYINGVQVASQSTVFTIDDTTGSLRIGRQKISAGAGQRFWNGKIDEVAIYNTALTAAEVAAHYAARTDTAASNSEWVVPKRGALVKFYDDRWDSRHAPVENGVLFTGYITEDPDPQSLGMRGGSQVWAYKCSCTSEEFLANSKRLPTKTYVNQTRGFIIKDLLQELFKESSPFPFNTSGVCDGGTEQLYQVDTNQKWAEVVAAFAAADGFTYWVIDSFIYYGPEDAVTTYNDPSYLLTIDEFDPRFTAENLDMKRVSRDIVNDMTVLGLDEPTDIVREHFVSDGYQGAHNLSFDPYGLDENKLIEDDFTSDIDTSIWQEVDTNVNYIQAFDGALNIVGGPGDPGTSVARTVYLLARKPIEMSGVIELRDGEIYFPPSPSGTGYIGGLYLLPTLANDQLWNGWKLDIDNNVITAIRPGGVTVASYALLRTRHYVLRRTIQVDRQLSTQSFTQLATGQSYSITNANDPVRVFMSWTIDEINNDDVNAVFTTTTLLGQYETTTTVPAYLLYAATVPNTCHYVTNFLSVSRPQQAVLKVNGKEQKLGNFLDGGKAVLQSDNGNGKLAWYQIPGAPTSLLTYPNTVLGETTNSVPGEGAAAYWRLGDASTTVADSSGRGRTGTASNVTNGVTGALNSDDDSAMGFNGTSSFVTGAGFEMAFAATGSFEAWFKTTSAGFNTIWSNRIAGGDTWGEVYAVSTGHIVFANSVAGTITSVRSGLNDGRWHHVLVSHENSQPTHIYIDGVLDSNVTFSRFPQATAPWFIGKDPQIENATPGASFFNGSLDEVCIYYGIPISAAQAKNHYSRGIAANTSVITVPKAGSRIALSYYRKRASRARLRSQDSIDTERERYHDDGIRQKVMRADEITPSPRTSEECLALAQAALYDSSRPRFEGKYNLVTVAGTPTELLFWPRPGDLVQCTLDLPDGDELSEPLSIQTVDSSFLGEDAYGISLGFGPINRFDLVIRNLILKRKSSFDDPVIADADTDLLETLTVGYPYPDDLRDCEVDDNSITATQFTANLAGSGIPADVVNYEVREDDTGWGQPNYIARFRATSRVFTRVKRDIRYYIRPYNAAGIYARKSAFIRVVAPVANTFQMAGVAGDINPTRVRVVIPIPRDPDYAGIIVQNGSASGATYYKGNGDINEILATGVSTLLSAGYMTVDIPNTGAQSLTVFVNSYNLLGLLGTGQTKVISVVAPGSFGTAGFSGANFTGTGGTWTVDSGDVAANDYSLNNNTVIAQFALNNTSVGGATTSTLRIAIPYTAVKATSTFCVIVDNGTRTSGMMEIAAGATTVTVKRADGANFAASSNNTSVTGQIIIQV